MRLSEVLELPELKNREIILIGTWKTGEKEFAVLSHRGQKVFPIPKLFHLVEVGPENRDPEIDPAEIRSILSRFGYFEAISKLSSK
jgi:hypothetical protein